MSMTPKHIHHSHRKL